MLGRNELSDGTWKITVDALPTLKESWNHLKANGGYCFTHVGKLERADGSQFGDSDAESVLVALTWYLSFVCGRRLGPALSRAYSKDGSLSWQAWDCHSQDSFAQRLSWSDDAADEHLEKPFGRFMKMWSDPLWNDVLRLAIHWYIEANAGSIEGAIVLTQNAFELLASAVLVENEGWLSDDGYGKLTAADRTRLLLRWAGIPTAIPPELGVLSQAAKANNWTDAPSAMTEIRNTITHPTRKNRAKFAKHPDEARFEAWTVGVWFLELVLLRLLDYRGTYGSRLSLRFRGQLEKVPWA
jgi:hypothetical protein